jgi:hypothetical protein
VNIRLLINDADSVNGQPQKLYTSLAGQSLSVNRFIPSRCPHPKDSACAVIFPTPVYDSLRLTYVNKGIGSDTLDLIWQTDCQDLGANQSAKTHQFTVKVEDGHCPIPATLFKQIRITVLPKTGCNTITSVSSFSFAEEMIFYPNPSQGLINIKLTGKEKWLYTLFSMEGKVVLQGNFSGSNLYSLQLPENEGVYFLRLTNGDETLQKKIIRY